MSLEIRSFQPADAEVIPALFIDALRTVYPDIKAGGWTDDLEEVEASYQIEGGDFLVGAQQGKIVAIGGLRKVSSITAEMKRFAVDPKVQGQGLGEVMLDQLEIRAAELDFVNIVLDTTEAQEAARHLYDKNDYLIFDRQDVDHPSGTSFHTFFYEKRLLAPMVLKTDQAGLELHELATYIDDADYFEAVQENPEHVDNYNNSVACKYDTLEKVRNRRLDSGYDIRTGIRDHGDFKGSISARVSKDRTQAEIGYWLQKSATRHGYATHAVKALTQHITPMFERVFAEVHIENKKSAQVLTRAGYKPVDKVARDWGPAIVFEPAK